MGIDIEIRGATRRNWLDGLNHGGLVGTMPITDGDDWMSLKNCTFLDRLLSEHSHADTEVLTAWENSIAPSDDTVSKPFTLQDMKDAVERLAKLDRDVAAVADTADGRQKVSRLVLDVYGDRHGIHLFVFPWDKDFMEKFNCASGSWPLSDIIKRAIAHGRDGLRPLRRIRPLQALPRTRFARPPRHEVRRAQRAHRSRRTQNADRPRRGCVERRHRPATGHGRTAAKRVRLAICASGRTF